MQVRYTHKVHALGTRCASTSNLHSAALTGGGIEQKRTYEKIA